MAKPKTAYVCSDCGASALQWFGACPSCGAAGTLTETIAERSTHRYAAGARAAVALSEVEARELERAGAGSRGRCARDRRRRCADPRAGGNSCDAAGQGGESGQADD